MDPRYLKNMQMFLTIHTQEPSEAKYNKIEALLQEGADVNAFDGNDNDNTPLHKAVTTLELRLVNILLENGADATIKNRSGNTPINMANDLLKTTDTQDIIKLLDTHVKRTIVQKNHNKHDPIDNNQQELFYVKKTGTAGISGQLYETKLTSLFLFRALNNNEIVNFYIGTNIHGIGALDDICLKYQINGDKRLKILFIQAKHKDNPNKAKLSIADLQNRNSDFGLVKYYESYLQIKNMFEKNKDEENKSDVMFQGNFINVDCNLILYTPLKSSIPEKYRKKDVLLSDTVRKFVSTCTCKDNAKQYHHCHAVSSLHSNNDIFQLSDINLLMDSYVLKEIETLGEELKNTLLQNNDRFYMNIMQYPLIRKFHLVLAQRVVEISIEKIHTNSDIKYRECKFRRDFLNTNDKLLKLLKEKIFENISDVEQSKYKKESYTFKLPLMFGNVDLMLSENTKKRDTRIKWLATTLVDLFEKYRDTKEIVIDDHFCEINSVPKGFIEKNGGIESLIGNLLILDKKTKKLKFNIDIKPTTQSELHTNAEKLLVELKGKANDIYDIYSYRFHIKLNDYTRLAFYANLQDELFAKDFLSKLWFLTNQGQENDVENVLKAEIKRKYKLEKVALLRIQSEAIFFKFHDEVQKWWKDSDTHAKVLTPYCNFYETSKNYGLDSPVLTVLHDLCTKKIKKVSVSFSEEACATLGLEEFLNDDNKKFITILTRESFLTMIKINQYFEKRGSNDVVFLDLEFIVKEEYYEEMLSELDNSKLKVFIIIHKNDDYEKELSETLNKVKAVSGIKIILLSEKDLNIISQTAEGTSAVFKNDEKLNLVDVFNHDSILNQWCISFQGRDTCLDKFLDTESKHLIHSDILSKLINREKIEIGKSIVHSRFGDVKKYYVHRKLSRDIEYSINSLNDIKDSVVLIVAEPGMGKSTLLSQLSINTKEADETNFNRSSWIVYVNLLDYSSEFKKFKNKEIDLNLNEAIRFVCKAAVKSFEDTQDVNEKQLKKTAFEVILVDDFVVIENIKLDSITALQLHLFAHFYNERNIKFLLDGFDEICPLYEKEVLCLLKLLTRNWHTSDCKMIMPSTSIDLFTQTSVFCDCKVDNNNQFQLWITTRSYNKVKNNLERELGKSAYTMNPLSRDQQLSYLDNYFRINFKMSDFTEENIANIEELCNYVSSILSDERAPTKVIDVPLYAVYLAAVEYFKSELQVDAINEKWTAVTAALVSYGETLETRMNFIHANSISGIPLYLYIAAEYFHDQVKSKINNKWDINIKSFKLFESFLDRKFKKIYYGEKKNVNINNPYNESSYQKDLQDFIAKHKKMALCAIFNNADLLKLLSKNELEEINILIKRVDDGEEKTGIVDKVVDNVPRFIHLLFAEYYAVEYICDLLKYTINAGSNEKLQTIWEFIINVILYKSVGGARTFFDHKLNNDEEFLGLISAESSKILVFELLLRQGRENRVTPEGFNNSFQLLKTSLNFVIEENLLSILAYFFTCIESRLNTENLEEFIKFISDSLVIFVAMGTSNEHFIDRLKACIAKVNDGDDRLMHLVFPSFATSVLPIQSFIQNPMSLMNMIGPVIGSSLPQEMLASLDSDDVNLPSSFRGVILDYINLLWDLTTDSYLH